MKIDSYGKLKINVLFDEEHWIEVEKAIASRSKRLGFATKQKISPMLRDILVAWAREEMKLADHGATQMRNTKNVQLDLTPKEQHLGMPPAIIPDNERWLHQPETAQALASAMEWATTHETRTDNAEAILDAASKAE